MLSIEQQKLFENTVIMVEKLTGTSSSDFMGGKRNAEYVKARTAIAMALLGCGWTLKNVGLALNRHHSTIIHMKHIYDNCNFAYKNSGVKDSLIDLSEIAMRHAHISHYNLSGRTRSYKISTMKKMVTNGSSLISAIGVFA